MELNLDNSTLNITPILSAFSDYDPYYLSGSIANLGANASQITWTNCLKLAKEYFPTICDQLRDDIKSYIADFGAWNEEEIEEMGDRELVAFIVQDIASKYNQLMESNFLGDRTDYGTAQENLAIVLSAMAESSQENFDYLDNFSVAGDQVYFYLGC